jgi:selenocysteine-specific elongation factor
MIVGTAGHIDHGKSALIRALTGVDTDRLKEEKARGISIDLGFAYRRLQGGEIIGFVDVPGHERLVHTMLAGATGIDFVLLVIAADDGVMPQTREHLAIVDLLGLKRGAVALNKSDLAGPDRLARVQAEIEALLARTGLQGAEIIPVSAITGAGLDRLNASFREALSSPIARPEQGRFRLAVDRSFVLAGHGTTVTGTVLSGAISIGDRVTISPAGLEARVRSIHAQNQPVEKGFAGQRCALVLSGAGISKDAVGRGDTVLDPELHAPTSRIDARLQVLKSEPRAIGQWFPVKLHHGAAEVPGRVVVLSGDSVEPGGSGFAQLVLERPAAAAALDRFILRDTASSRTIGGGVFIDLRPPERRRRTQERLAQIEALSQPDPLKALELALHGPNSWIDFGAFIRDRAISEDLAGVIASRLGLVAFPLARGTPAMRDHVWGLFRAQALEMLDAFHGANPELPGISLEQMRRSLAPPLPAPLFMAAIKKLREAGDIALDRVWMRRPHHLVDLSSEDEQRLALILRLLKDEPYRPPRVRDIAKTTGFEEGEVRRILRMSCRRGEAGEVAHDHFFTRATMEAMADIAIDLAARSPSGSFTAAEFRDRLNNGRKVAIQILEFFDRHGLTIRRKDLRKINAARIELFSPQRQPGITRAGSNPAPNAPAIGSKLDEGRNGAIYKEL